MIFSTAVTQDQKQRETQAQAAEEPDDCSVGSLTAVAHGYSKSTSSVTNDDSSSDEFCENVITRLNAKIHKLFLDWEHRRETTKERNNLEKKKLQSQGSDASRSASAKATPHISAFVSHVKNSCFKRKIMTHLGEGADESKTSSSSSSSYLPYPSQMRTLAPLSSTRMSDYITSRTKTRLSRKSERVLIIDRMKGTEKAFQSRRMTSDQMRILMQSIEGPDERQHAALLFITKLTDVVEIETDDDFYQKLELSAECEKRVKLVASILSAEARSEDHLICIHKLYTKCFHIRQKIKEVMSEAKKGEESDSEYLQIKTIQKLKDAPLVSPKLQSGMRNQIKDFKAHISVMRQAVSEVHTSLNSGFTKYLTEVREEQDTIAKLTSELKLIVNKCESVCRMRGTLTAGRPEYLVFHRLKVSDRRHCQHCIHTCSCMRLERIVITTYDL
jgi:hypothetical protein